MICYVPLLLCTWCSLSTAHKHRDHDLIENKAVMSHGSVDFKCSPTEAEEHVGDTLRWKFWRPGETGAGITVKEIEIYADFTRTTYWLLNLVDFPPRSVTYKTSGNVHQVLIAHVDRAHAGIFQCSLINAGIHSRGNLLVL
jgi:hypothetical protein